MRLLYLIAGLISLGLGLLGVVLPILPTVPFLILAAFCFAQSSEKLHNWLISHKVFGPPIMDWRERGAISLRGKQLATASVAFVFGLSLVLGVRPLVLIIQAVALSLVMLFIWTRPSD